MNEIVEKTEPRAPAAPVAPAAPAPSGDKAPRHVFLIDGSGFIFRAYHARHGAPPLRRKSDGMPTEVVTLFCNMLDKLRRETDADHVAVVFDASGKTFRNEVYAEYKAHRPPLPDDLIPQFAHVRQAADAFSICQIELENFEADDLIATYTRKALEAGAEVTVVSSDKDLMQLVGERVKMLDPINYRLIGEAEVREKFGVGPERVRDVMALAGDSVDNVPGVPGIGVKRAAEFINTYGDLETLLVHAKEIKQPARRQALLDHEEDARLSKRLVTLDDQVPPPCPLSALVAKPYDPQRLFPFLDEMELHALKGRIAGRLAAGPAAAAEGERPQPLIPPALPFSAPRRYGLLTSEEALSSWIGEAKRAGTVALAPAPSGLSPALSGIALAFKAGEAAYLPFDDGKAGLLSAAATGLSLDAALPLLRPLFEDRGVLKIGHDIKGAQKLLLPSGVRLEPFDCTMLMSYTLDGGQFDHSLESVIHREFDEKLPARKEILGSGKSALPFAELALEAARDYCALRADATLRLHARLKARLVKERMAAFYETIERPLSPVVAAMEVAGIKVDHNALSELSRDFARRIAELEKKTYAAVGSPFNLGSPKQLGEVLFEKLQLPGGKKGKTGAYGTDASVLEGLVPLHPAAALVLEWRQLSKLKSTYADALAAEIDPKDGRVHTSYSLAATATGRFSSTEPNLQNIPIRTEEGRRIRRAFVAEPGQVLLSADYSQIELRLAAHVADVPALKEAFRQGVDIHALTASEVFGVPLSQMDALTRRRAKAINFGILYGLGPFGLARQIGVGQAEAAAYIQAYFERFPEIRDYMEKTKAECRAKGYVRTIFGRKCFIPGTGERNATRRAAAERQAINAPLQGSAADIIRRAMVRIPRVLAAASLKAKMLLQVHDELLFEVPKGEVEKTAALVKGVMEKAALPRCRLSVPLVVETGSGANWTEAH